MLSAWRPSRLVMIAMAVVWNLPCPDVCPVWPRRVSASVYPTCPRCQPFDQWIVRALSRFPFLYRLVRVYFRAAMHATVMQSLEFDLL